MKQLATDSVQRPSLALLGVEPFRAAMELARHKFANSGTTKPGDGHAVVIFPGLGANGGSVATLREHCRSLGYDAFDWGQGFNTGPQGDLDAWLHTLKSKVVDLLARPHPTGHSHRLEPGRALRARNRQADGTACPTGDHDRNALQRGGRPHQRGVAVPLAERHFGGAGSGACAHLHRYAPPRSSVVRMVLLRGRRVATRSGRASYMTSKSTAAISTWAGTGMCLRRSKTASVSNPGHGADMCARNEQVAR